MHPSPHGLPTQSTLDATVSLLSDSDPRVADACRAQLLEWGPVIRPALLEAARAEDPRLRVRARDILIAFDRLSWRRQVTRVACEIGSNLGGRDDSAPLLRAISEASRLGGARVVGHNELEARLEAWARELEPRVRRCRSAAASARALAELLGGERELQGRTATTGSRGCDVDDELLESVIESRRGSAIALSILYMIVGRRAGLEVTGIELPDHFLVRVHGARPVIVDPFHGGRTVTKADCYRYLRFRGHRARSTEYLDDRSDRRVFAAWLRRLARAVAERGSSEVVSALGALADAFGPARD